MKPVYKAVTIVAAVVAVLFVVIIVLGYVGIIRVPGVSPTILAYSNATELSQSDVQRILLGAGDVPTIAEMQSYGLTVHGYGTNDSKGTVENYYEAQIAGWTQDLSDSGPYWSFTVWRNIGYGFGLAVADNPLLKLSYGYNTAFIVVEGPASAWLPMLGQIP